MPSSARRYVTIRARASSACVALASIGLVACASHDVARDRVTGAAALTIATTPLALSSDALGHDVVLRVAYPARHGRYPLVIVAPGSAAGNELYSRLTDHWATRGYVVLQLTVPDPNTAATSNRIGDVELVLDSLDEVERRIPALRRSLDRAHIAVAGHDAGAWTALALAAQNRDAARITALVLLDVPTRAGKSPASSWLGISKPTFALTATYDRLAPPRSQSANSSASPRYPPRRIISSRCAISIRASAICSAIMGIMIRRGRPITPPSRRCKTRVPPFSMHIYEIKRPARSGSPKPTGPISSTAAVGSRCNERVAFV